MLCETGASGRGMQLNLLPTGCYADYDKPPPSMARVAAGSPLGGCCCEFGGRDCSKTRTSGRGLQLEVEGLELREWSGERRGPSCDHHRKAS